MSQHSFLRNSARVGTGPVLILAATIYMLWSSWLKWPDVLIDFGRELYIPWQLSEGKVLYRDISVFTGPFSFYLNSLWFRLFGVSVQTLVYCNIALLFVQIALLYMLLLRMTGRLASTIACLAFVFLFACSQMTPTGNYNSICPYTHEAVHGSLLVIAGLLLLSQYFLREQRLCLAGSGFMLGLAFLTRPEPVVAGAIAVAVGLAAQAWSLRRPMRSLVGPSALFLASSALPVLVAWGLLSLAMPAHQAARGVFTPWLTALNADLSGQEFYLAGMGFDKPGSNLAAMAVSSFLWAVLFLPVALLSRFYHQLPKPFANLCVAAVAFAVALSAKTLSDDTWFGIFNEAPKALPVLMAVSIISLLVLLRGERERSDSSSRLAAQLAVAVFAAAMLLKMILNVRFFHYGFVLAMPATVFMVCLLSDWIPNVVRRSDGNSSIFRWTSISILILFVAKTLPFSLEWYDAKSVRVGSGADTFISDTPVDHRGRLVNEMLTQIEERVGPQQTLGVLPEGVMLNYLSRRVNPTPYTNFMPTELAAFGEDRILHAFRQQPPDYIVLVHKDTSEYGHRFFGSDYGRRIAAWITVNYRLVSLVGDPPFRDHRFGMLLLEHKNAPTRKVSSVGQSRYTYTW